MRWCGEIIKLIGYLADRSNLNTKLPAASATMQDIQPELHAQLGVNEHTGEVEECGSNKRRRRLERH